MVKLIPSPPMSGDPPTPAAYRSSSGDSTRTIAARGERHSPALETSESLRSAGYLRPGFPGAHERCAVVWSVAAVT